MDDASIRFTSKFVCDSLAERAVRDINEQQKDAASKFVQIISPIAKEIGKQTKPKRGAVGDIVKRMVRDLSNERAITEINSVDLTPSKLSTNEIHHVRFCIMGGDGDWVEFLGTDATITRRSIRMSASHIDVRIHRHALTRYMQRELKETANLFAEVMPAIKLSPIIGACAAQFSERHIAAPLGKGMLLGRFRIVDAVENPPLMVRMTLDPKIRNKVQDREEIINRETIVEGTRIIVEFMTYVDCDLMSENRSKLHKVLTQYWDHHKDAIDAIFNTVTFDGTILPTRDVGRLQQAVKIMFKETEQILDSRVWHDFVKSVGQDHKDKD
jgi:hypothetical protein